MKPPEESKIASHVFRECVSTNSSTRFLFLSCLITQSTFSVTILRFSTGLTKNIHMWTDSVMWTHVAPGTSLRFSGHTHKNTCCLRRQHVSDQGRSVSRRGRLYWLSVSKWEWTFISFAITVVISPLLRSNICI